MGMYVKFELQLFSASHEMRKRAKKTGFLSIKPLLDYSTRKGHFDSPPLVTFLR